jgi:hypothetical protein
MRMLIVTLSAALMLLSMVPQAGAAKSHLKCGGDNLQCGNLAKVCNPKNGKCCCLSYSHAAPITEACRRQRPRLARRGAVYGRSAQQVWQLGDIRRDPSSLVAIE